MGVLKARVSGVWEPVVNGSLHHTSHEAGGSDAIVALSGAVITSGTVADARLSSNVAFVGSNNLFTASQRISASGPMITITDTSAPTDAKVFRVLNSSQALTVQTTSDNGSTASTVWSITRAGNVTVAGTLTTGNPQTISGTRPALVLQQTGETAKNRVSSVVTGGHIGISRNVSYDGANWNLDDTSLTGSVLNLNQSAQVIFGTLTAGANPRTLTVQFSVDSNGDASVTRNLYTTKEVISHATLPQLQWNETGQTTDQKRWAMSASGANFYLQAYTDAEALQTTLLSISRAGTLSLYGGQILFPATQNASSNANVLDDYEEGTWIPTFAAATPGSPTYALRGGNYIKIGRNVWFSLRLALSALGGASGALTITGLPFSAGDHCPVTMGYGGIASSGVWIGGYVGAGTTLINMLFKSAASVSWAVTMTAADFGATGDIMLTGTYISAS